MLFKYPLTVFKGSLAFFFSVFSLKLIGEAKNRVALKLAYLKDRAVSGNLSKKKNQKSRHANAQLKAGARHSFITEMAVFTPETDYSCETGHPLPDFIRQF